MQKDESSMQLDKSLPGMCLKWFKISRRARKEHDWQSLYDQMLAIMIPDIDPLQWLVPREMLNEHLQLFLNSLIYTEWSPHTCFVQHLTNDILVLISGRLMIEENIKAIDSPAALVTLPVAKNEGIRLSTETGCMMLRGERKHMQKLKNDILKQDRQIKQNLLSQHLFCGLTPVFPLSAVRLIYFKEGSEILLEGDELVVLQSGLVLRRPKRRGEGSQLTQGSILSLHKLCPLLQSPYPQPEQTLTAMQSCTLLSFQAQEFMRILKLNPNLKQLLDKKLKDIFDQRTAMNTKCEQLKQQLTSRVKVGDESVRMHYSIQFRNKNRPNTAGVVRSFRKKWDSDLEDQFLSDFVTFDRYDKMISSKQRVATAKANCQNYQHFHQPEPKKKTGVSSIEYEKRVKLQSKLFKLQSGKIQKISQRESKTDTSGMREIKKNLFRVTHLFDQPLDPNLTSTPPAKLQDNEAKATNMRRMSGIKPEEYLKEAYLSAFIKKSSNRQSQKDIEVASSKSSDKQNMHAICIYSQSDSVAFRKGKQMLSIKVKGPYDR